MSYRRSFQSVLGLARYVISWRPFAGTHYSQEGEDLILSRLFRNQDFGHYVEVGAHHPFRFSNSYWAYRKGWSGVVIDGAPGTKRAFTRHRPRDIAVEECVSDGDGTVDFFTYSESALNTTQDRRRRHIETITGRSAKVSTVRARPLARILEDALPTNWGAIDFMSIDIEGSEWLALTSNDWRVFRPRVLVVEMLGATLGTMADTKEYKFLTQHGYSLVSMLFHSAFFVSDPNLIEGWISGGSSEEHS